MKKYFRAQLRDFGCIKTLSYLPSGNTFLHSRRWTGYLFTANFSFVFFHSSATFMSAQNG